MAARQDAARPERAKGRLALKTVGEAPNLDQLVYERVRLGILSALAANGPLTLHELRTLLDTTDSKLSVQVRKLEEAGYVTCNKSLEGRMRLTAAGQFALDGYPGSLSANANEGRTEAKVLLAQHVVLDLHDPETGRLDAKRISAYLHIPLSSLAAVTGGSIAAIHKSPAANSLQPALSPIAQTISVLAEFLQSKEHVLAWLYSPHPDLGNQHPMRLILEGHASAVADMLRAALAGQPS
jgi:DNA-binding transcriptional ArsR family regulator